MLLVMKQSPPRTLTVLLTSIGERGPHSHGSLRSHRWLRSSHGDVCSSWFPVGEIHHGSGLHCWTHRLSVGLIVSHAQSDLRHGQ